MRKIIFLLTIFSILLVPLVVHQLTSPSPVFAQTTVQERVEAMGSDQPLNLDKYASEDILSTTVSLACSFGGCETSSGERVTGGALPFLKHSIAYMIADPPVESGEYIADLIHNTNLVPQAYAQGFGFTALSPLLKVWKGFRNATYFLFVIVFVIVGLMIMFRAQLNPQTVVTVQSALPKMVITLILITFSYAIAGFIVDLIYLSIFFLIEVLDIAGIVDNPALAQNTIFGRTVISIGLHHFTGFSETAGLGAQAVGDILENALPDVIAFIAEPIVFLIIIVAIIIALFRTFFTLLGAYVSIIMQTIFAPIFLLPNAIPGVNAFTKWLRTLVANAAIFPVLTVFIIVAASISSTDHGQLTNEFGLNALSDANDVGIGQGSGFSPPLITDKAEGNSATSAQVILGLGMVMLLPEVANMVKKMLGVEDQLGQLAFQNFQQGYQRGPINWGKKGISSIAGGVGNYMGTTIGAGIVRRLPSPSKLVGRLRPTPAGEVDTGVGRTDNLTLDE